MLRPVTVRRRSNARSFKVYRLMRDEIFQRQHAVTHLSNVDLMNGALKPAAAMEPMAVSFGPLLSMLQRHLAVLLLTVVLAFGATAVVVEGMSKQCASQAVLIIAPQRTQVSDLRTAPADAEQVSRLILKQIGIFNSPALGLDNVAPLEEPGLAADLRARRSQRASALSWVASARNLGNVVESIS
jgi:uncharacterized protein involved in exopolysaccharide biosynthesis